MHERRQRRRPGVSPRAAAVPGGGADAAQRGPGDAGGRLSPTTIRDVASRAGVSTATVSRVLAGIGRPRAATAEAVISAARALDYRPSGVARSLRQRRTRTLGLIITDIQNPFFPELVQAADDAARAKGYSILLGSAAYDEVRAMHYLDLMVDRRVDGMIVASSQLSEASWRWLLESPVPVVVVNAEPAGLAVPVIGSDNEGGSRCAVEHLVRLGHRRIGYIRGPGAFTASVPRLEGFRRGCAEAGIPAADSLVVDGTGLLESGERGARQLLESGRGITAIVCYNDLTAIGALRALRAAGRSVPGEVSVVGFDDIAAASWVSPALTTVAQQKAAMGRLAVERLAAALDEPSAPRPPISTRLPTVLQERESTGPPPPEGRRTAPDRAPAVVGPPSRRASPIASRASRTGGDGVGVAPTPESATCQERRMVRIANAPCSWGVIEGISGERGGYVRVLDEIRDTGYEGTELGDWGFMPTDPGALRDELAGRGLALVASWVSVQLHDASQHAANARDAVRAARLLAAVGGPENLIVLGNDPYGDPVRTRCAGRVTPELGMTDDQWRTFAGGATDVARRVADETGLRTVLHPHIGTLVESPAEARRLAEMTDGSLLGLCLDTGHWTFAGGDPVAAIRDFADRIWHVHFKDHDPDVARASRANEWDGPTSVGHGVFCELGQGSVDFPAVLAALGTIGYRGWIVVEQDVLPGMGTPCESARRNRDYLRSIGA